MGCLVQVLDLKRSGVIVAMITGDSSETAIAIATKLNMLDDPNPTYTGRGTAFTDIEASSIDGMSMSGTTVDQLSEVRDVGRLGCIDLPL